MIEAATWARPRAGLSEVCTRLRDRDCTIAYMGASVSVQRDGFRPRLHRLLCEETGRAHRSVAAAVGATGAITGVFLMDELVLPHRPHVAFVEYATSDVAGSTPPAHLAPVLEGIVGKLRDAGCEPCFLYLHRSDVDMSASDVVATYEQVAERHGVASIDVSAAIRARALDDRAVLRDVVHTTGVGSDVTAAVIRDAVACASPSRRAPAATLGDAGFRRARLVRPSEAATEGPAFAEGRFRLVYPYVELGPGETLRAKVDGELVGLLVVLGPHSGYVEVTAARDAREYLLWDDECSYERLGSVILEPFAPTRAEVTLEVSARAVDRGGADAPPRPLLKLVALMVRPCT